jgi:tetratricopeptide (TPR) repeat protein
MPAIDKGSFHMVDHWIRVHPEQLAQTKHTLPAGHAAPAQSQVRPLREFVRLIATPNREEAEAARARLDGGDSFFRVARETSKDITAPIGGYLGAMWLADLDPRLTEAAARLAYGQISPPVDMGDHWMIIQRLPRDFKYEAEQLFEQAVTLRAKGSAKSDKQAALEKYQQALIIYPNFLRALVGMGTVLAESGNVTAAAAALDYAVQTYRDDSDAEFNLGITLGGLGRHEDELAAYLRAIELNPDQDAVYENLGALYFANGDVRKATEAFQKGLQADPLSAVLYYDLSLVLDQAGDKDAAAKALALAVKIDPRIEKRRLPQPPRN